MLSYAMTISKSQGQSLDCVGLYLPTPVFSHGQLYVAASRVKSKSGLKILIHDNENKPLTTTTNVVFKEVFNNVWLYCMVTYLCSCILSKIPVRGYFWRYQSLIVLHSYAELLSCFKFLFECIEGKDGDVSKLVPSVIIYVGLLYLLFTIFIPWICAYFGICIKILIYHTPKKPKNI